MCGDVLTQKNQLLYNFLSVFAIMLRFSANILKKKCIFQNFIKKYNFYSFDQNFKIMLNIVKIGSSLSYEIDLFWGYEILKLTFIALFMLEIPVSLLHIVHNTSKYTLKAENQKTCHGAKVRSLTSVGCNVGGCNVRGCNVLGL